MLRMIQSASGRHAKSYFADALSRSDYYLDDQELSGRFNGLLAKRLGLKGNVTKEEFFALCENINPKTGKPLTPRTTNNRTIGYDINFHCPKSVSVLHVLSKDDHIRLAFEKSIKETMQDIENDAKTRVRKKKTYDDRTTGELLYSDFIHQTARPTKNATPDPHLHCHCFVFNVTWDKEEKQFKAGQFRDIKRDMPFYQAMFHKRLSDELLKLGYAIKKNNKSFEIEGIPQSVIELFSKRTNEIGQLAKEKGITNPKELGELGAKTRAKKQKGLTMSQLKADWRKQINELVKEEKGGEENIIRNNPERRQIKIKAKECVDHSLEHSFERASVISERKILETAYKYSLGDATTTIDQVTNEFKQNRKIIHVKEKYKTLCTTKEVLLEEKKMVELAKQSKGKFKPLYKEAPALTLKGQQADAVTHVLTTPNQISIIRGAAGTGKTTLLKEAVHYMNKAGKQVITVAPTAQASRGILREDGFANAETVAKLLIDKKMQEQLSNQILLVDEAGLLGTKDMKAILELVKEKNSRLILVGDTRQHASVARGDALRIINTVAGIKTAEVSKIYRQRSEDYKKAVEHLSKGNIKDGFEKLDSIGAIKKSDPLKPNEKIIEDYLQVIKKRKTALIISPTHDQGEKLTDDLRIRLREEELIGYSETMATRLKNLNLTEAQKKDHHNFKKGLMVQFNQHAPNIKRGSQWEIENISGNEITLKDAKGKTIKTLHSKMRKFDVYEKSEIGLSKGDKLTITRNGYDKEKRRLNNGQSLEVVAIDKSGDITLQNTNTKNKYKLPSDFGHINYAYCVTSHASQGKTIDEVFISQPGSTFTATNAKQFYVSVSRARDQAHIYTEDKEALMDYASQIGDRQSAIELTSKKNKQEKFVQHVIREKNQELPKVNLPKDIPNKNIAPDKKQDRDYAPGL